MSEVVIRTDNLGKQYRIGGRQNEFRTLRDALTDAFTAPFQRAKRLWRGQPSGAADMNETIWALKGVSLEIKRGEVVGIIGRNGAGKTTLLKILSRITEPTEGFAEIHGRVGSLLEVGTGFHPELTGRENIYLNGAILGMKKAEIVDKFDEIVAFAEIEKFIDTPVKHYSSGMYVRLAFAVAAHLEPEILIVDEVLAVGDAAFQKKCLGKMGDVAREGRTVLFVSHNMVAMQNLCERVLWLDNGIAVDDGRSDRIVSKYFQVSHLTATERSEVDLSCHPQNDIVQLHRASIRPLHGTSVDPITIRTPLVLEFEFTNRAPGTLLDINVHLLTEQNITAFAGGSFLSSDSKNNVLPLGDGRYLTRCFIPGDLLNDGTYYVRLFFGKDNRYVVCNFDSIIFFVVQDSSERRGVTSHHKLPGVVRPLLTWQTELVGENIMRYGELNDEH
jgi:lipopolysaccharide transport system ATP-binding protein